MKITCNYKEFAAIIRWCEATRIAGKCADCPFRIYCQYTCKGIPSVDASDVNFCIV